jgi:hypothetical protein
MPLRPPMNLIPLRHWDHHLFPSVAKPQSLSFVLRAFV